MKNNLKLLSDSQQIVTTGTRGNRFVYPLSIMQRNKNTVAIPMIQSSCAMIDHSNPVNPLNMMSNFATHISIAYQEGSDVMLHFNPHYANSKQLIDILNECESNDTEYPVIAYIKGWFWVCMEEDARYCGCKLFSEWN